MNQIKALSLAAAICATSFSSAVMPLPAFLGAPAQTQVTEVKHQKYRIELLVPEEGVFAGEEIDIEFRITDTTQKDELQEDLGIANVESSAVVTMPSMAGMPAQIPEIHREGIPGYYGMPLFFPHGGDYQISLKLKLPTGEMINATFLILVKDERPAGSQPTPKPFWLKVLGFPANAAAGQPVDLKLRVIDHKTGFVQKDFQTVHEQKFHLLIASEDLGWFAHEHPTMAPDGTWTYRATFPAKGKYFIYGDVAPTGKGSQILVSHVNIAKGPKPTWNTKWKANLGPVLVQGVNAKMRPIDLPVPIGKGTVVEIALTDTKGKAVLDTVPWLGAAGHLMILHRDGRTVVHSHPKEDEEATRLARLGKFRFTARFPKAGLYRAYAQFSHHGKIKTFGFGIDVK